MTSQVEPLFYLSAQYEEMLARGIRLSGEDQHFFIEGRVRALRAALPTGWQPTRILDFGCGVGHTVPHLQAVFPGADVVGVDTVEPALARAAETYGGAGVRFCPLAALDTLAAFDLCYVNGVFHHVESPRRPEVLAVIRRALAPGGFLSLFENNPWNPGARLVMARIPFDRAAVPLSPTETRRLVGAAGFRLHGRLRSLFYFPRPLAWLRVAEPWLAALPLGAQYHVLAVKVGA